MPRRYGRRVALTSIAVVLGVAIGLSLPPRPTRFASPRIQWPVVLVAGVALQFVAGRGSGGGAVALALLGAAALVVFAVVNLHLTGVGVLLVGLAANVVPIAVDGGMPVRRDALVDAHVVAAADVDFVELAGPRHVATSSDRLTFLGDIVPVRPLHQVVSFGDLIIFVATIDVLAHLLRRQHPRMLVRTGRYDADIAPTFGGGGGDGAMSRARPVQDWGVAPSASPESGSQYSDRPDAVAPRTVDAPTSAPAHHSR